MIYWCKIVSSFGIENCQDLPWFFLYPLSLLVVLPSHFNYLYKEYRLSPVQVDYNGQETVYEERDPLVSRVYQNLSVNVYESVLNLTRSVWTEGSSTRTRTNGLPFEVLETGWGEEGRTSLRLQRIQKEDEDETRTVRVRVSRNSRIVRDSSPRLLQSHSFCSGIFVGLVGKVTREEGTLRHDRSPSKHLSRFRPKVKETRKTR